MGITGLLPFLKDFAEDIDLTSCRGSVIAVDAYIWLYKGGYCCPYQLVCGIPTSVHIDFLVKRAVHLLELGIRPILVFDGRSPVLKHATEEKRRAARLANKNRGMEELQKGNCANAFKFFKQAVRVEHLHAVKAIDICREKGIDCLVAPCEADSQLVYLQQSGLADYIISEDSDLLVAGDPEHTKVIYKYNIDTDQGELIRLKTVFERRDSKFAGFTMDMFRYMCIFSGSDYLPSLRNVGINRAYQAIKQAQDIVGAISIFRGRGCQVPEDYIENVTKALNCLMYQPVYDPYSFSLIPLRNTQNTGIDFQSFCGDFTDMTGLNLIHFVSGNILPSDGSSLSRNIPKINIIDTYQAHIHRLVPPSLPAQPPANTDRPMGVQHDVPAAARSHSVATGARLPTYTLPFKVIGAAHHRNLQDNLETGYQKMYDEKIGLAARLTPEPDNEYDKMAILVEIDWGDGFKPVGWIPSELTKFIHPILNEKEYLSVSVKHIKFRVLTNHVGFYITINVSKEGEWHKDVIRASKGVK